MLHGIAQIYNKLAASKYFKNQNTKIFFHKDYNTIIIWGAKSSLCTEFLMSQKLSKSNVHTLAHSKVRQPTINCMNDCSHSLKISCITKHFFQLLKKTYHFGTVSKYSVYSWSGNEINPTLPGLHMHHGWMCGLGNVSIALWSHSQIYKLCLNGVISSAEIFISLFHSDYKRKCECKMWIKVK